MPKQPRNDASSQKIRPLTLEDLEVVVDLSLLAWEPVFISFENILGPVILDRLYRPHWREAQAAQVRKNCLADDSEAFVLTSAEDVAVGFLVLEHDEDESVGAIEMIAVHPENQRQGHARALMEFAIQRFRDQRLALINVGTGGDHGHAPARALYESVGFTGVPLVAYYLAPTTWRLSSEQQQGQRAGSTIVLGR